MFAHIGPDRGTRDVDIALATALSDEDLEKRGYRLFIESGKVVHYTPRGIKVDIYTKHVGGILFSKIFETSVFKQVLKDEIRVICLEALLIAKLRASRPQDIQDIQELCRHEGASIQWEVVESIATDMEVRNLKVTVQAIS